jgi:transposase
MPNILQVNEQEAIATLAKQGWAIRRIARELGLHRKTVRRYLDEGRSDSKCTTILIAGSPPKCTTLITGKMGRKLVCDSVAALIESKAQRGLSAQRIYQDLKIEFQFAGSYPSVSRFVRKLRAVDPQRVWRIEVAPAEEAQVDFGSGAPIVDSQGRKRRSWVFRIVLSYSRKAYSEAVLRQDTESFIRCLENAFRHFGGVPRTLNLDNLKAAVLKFDFADPELNPKLREFARHYGVAILPCLPRTPEHKGKVENSVGYVKGNALAGRVFDALAAQNQHLAHWEKTVADVRIHGTTKRQVVALFEEEKKSLVPLPPTLFPCFSEAPRTVHRDGYVEVAKSYYALGPEYIGQKVWARWDAREVRLFNERWQQLQLYRRLEPGKFSETLGAGGGRGTLDNNLAYWQCRAAELGTDCATWSNGLVEQRGIEALRSLMGLARLADKHSFRAINAACAKALAKGAWRLRDVRALLASHETQTQLSFAEHHPLIRNLSEYGLFIKTQIQNYEPHPH